MLRSLTMVMVVLVANIESPWLYADDRALIATISQVVAETRSDITSGCQFAFELHSKLPGSPVVVETHKYAISPSCYLHESIPTDPKVSASISCYNEKYGFRLGRLPSRKQWNITAIELVKPSQIATRGKAKQLAKLSDAQVASLSFHFLDVEGVPLDMLISDKTFQIVNTANVGERLSIEFIANADSFIGTDRIVKGKLWLLPNSGFVIDEYDVITHF